MNSVFTATYPARALLPPEPFPEVPWLCNNNNNIIIIINIIIIVIVHEQLEDNFMLGDR
jgi:hypothetical protein